MKIIEHGNIFDDDAEYIVIPVNSVGVMGKGLAFEAKKRWPEVYRFYRSLCKQGVVLPGQTIYFEDDATGQSVWLATTKDHWRNPSKVEWVESICRDLAMVMMRNTWSMAVPALGCGEGGLRWADVLPIMKRYFVNCNINIYAPLEP